MSGLKLSMGWYLRLIVLSTSIGLTSGVMAIFSLLMGMGREYYHTSTPVELYGVFGWFTISWYLIYISMFSIIFYVIIFGFTSPIISNDKGVNVE